jgi:RNA polymerase sigma-70 factor, ECF subfamily
VLPRRLRLLVAIARPRLALAHGGANRSWTPARTSGVVMLFAEQSPFAAGARARLSEEQLLVRAGGGDEDAFAELYDRLARLAYGVALRILRSPQLAEEATQEAFLAVWREADRFRASRGSARSWVLMIVRARAIDRTRREQRRGGVPASLDIALERGEADEAITPDMAAELVERERVGRALEGLDPQARVLIELAYFGGLSQSEIADHLGLPLGTVKRRTFETLRRLRTLIGEPA